MANFSLTFSLCYLFWRIALCLSSHLTLTYDSFRHRKDKSVMFLYIAGKPTKNQFQIVFQSFVACSCDKDRFVHIYFITSQRNPTFWQLEKVIIPLLSYCKRSIRQNQPLNHNPAFSHLSSSYPISAHGGQQYQDGILDILLQHLSFHCKIHYCLEERRD